MNTFTKSVLLLIATITGCAKNQPFIQEDIKLDELRELYEQKNFTEVDKLLSKNKLYIDKYDVFAEYQLHRNIMRIQSSRDNNFNYFEVMPSAVHNAKENSKTTYLSQSYQEYVWMLKGSPKFVDGYCPAKPIELACACRVYVLAKSNITLDYFSVQRDMWFSEYLSKTCPNDSVKAIQIFSASAVSGEQATALLAEEKKNRNEVEYRNLENKLCRAKDIFTKDEAPYLFIENSNLVNCDLEYLGTQEP